MQIDANRRPQSTEGRGQSWDMIAVLRIHVVLLLLLVCVETDTKKPAANTRSNEISPAQRLLTDLELLLKMRKQLTESIVSCATLNDVGIIVRSLHDLLPRLVDVWEPLRLLRQLFRDVATAEHCLEINPQVLDDEPVFNDLGRCRQLRDPLLDLGLEWCVVPWTMFQQLWGGRIFSAARIISNNSFIE